MKNEIVGGNARNTRNTENEKRDTEQKGNEKVKEIGREKKN